LGETIDLRAAERPALGVFGEGADVECKAELAMQFVEEFLRSRLDVRLAAEVDIICNASCYR